MKITIGISSGIAAFKILDLIPMLQKKGHEVQVIMTRAATHMISVKDVEKIIKNKVHVELFEKNFNYKEILKDRTVDHIEIAKNTDLFVIAPATANTIAKMANGQADDFLTTTILATLAPVLVVPSMNTNMWNHMATQKNLKVLTAFGYTIMNPDSGWLACGTQGMGRLPEIETIAKEIEIMTTYASRLKGKKILVTAGGTTEPIDSARVLTNKSTGKMGVAIAEVCYKQGADVLLVRAENAVTTNLPIEQLTFQTAADLKDILQRRVLAFDTIIHAAAVSDYTVEELSGKMDSNEPMTLELQPSEKIINNIKEWNPHIQLIGFKAIHGINENTLADVLKEKFTDTKADYFIANDISRRDIAFGSDKNEVYIVAKSGKPTTIEKSSKKNIAEEIVRLLL